MSEPTGRAKGGVARAKALSPEKRREIAQKGVIAKAEIAKLPIATHGSSDHPLKIGDIEIPCYVLENEKRVLSQRGLQTGIGMSSGGSKTGEQRIAVFLGALVEKSINNSEISARAVELIEKVKNPLQFRLQSGGRTIYGYEATILADICDLILSARRLGGILLPQQAHIANQCELLVRGFARVGIIALVDEATGYQRDRAKDALAQILEAFVAKEIQPYVKTFPADYYEQLFRLYGLPYPPIGNRSWRPQFFGKITNEVVYARLAPELLPELKKLSSKAEKKAKLHQWLTEDIGHPKLREHLASIVAIQKLSDSPPDFINKVNRIHPRHGDTIPMNLDVEKP